MAHPTRSCLEKPSLDVSLVAAATLPTPCCQPPSTPVSAATSPNKRALSSSPPSSTTLPFKAATPSPCSSKSVQSPLPCIPTNLFQSSTSFFQALKSLSTLAPVLEASCAASRPTCSAIMSSYAQQLKTDGACGLDYRSSNPTVLEAYNGFLAYEPVYNATCMKASESTHADWCFADAALNASASTSSYIYYLPLGVALPTNAAPACTPCLARTMAAYVPWAGNGTQPLSATYGPAVKAVNAQCGTNFVNAGVPTVTNGGGRLLVGWALGIVVMVVALMV